MIKVRIKVDKIISENTYLAPGIRYTKARKPYPYLYKKPEVHKYQEDIINHLRDLRLRDQILENKEMFNNLFFSTEWVFYRLEKIEISDLTNMKKLVEDALVRFIREECEIKTFDDCYIIEDKSKKVYLPDFSEIDDKEHEYIDVILKPYEGVASE